MIHDFIKERYFYKIKNIYQNNLYKLLKYINYFVKQFETFDKYKLLKYNVKFRGRTLIRPPADKG